MYRILVSATEADEIRVAINQHGVLTDLDIEVPGTQQTKANIYKGRISSIEPSLGAVFVDYGSERHGFLPFKEISSEYFLMQDIDPENPPDMKKLLRLGQEIVVQVDKEERGTKGAALTTFISLAGSYLVLMPNNPAAGGVSRRIEGEDREQLKSLLNQLNVPEGMGIIVRTAGVGRDKPELEWDLSVLLRYWEAIKQAAIVKPGPYLIHQESNIVIRALRDHLRQETDEVVIDDEQSYLAAREYIAQVKPDYLDRIKLYQENLPIFCYYQVEKQIESVYQREVRLPSGASIVIDHTEALVAIDINSAQATTGSDIEETALNTNREAAKEIARQLRLRDIGGLIVIDFIDMTSIRHQREIETQLRQALSFDRARIQIGRISRFGLLEMSRQRLRSTFSKHTQTTCPRCEGLGMIRGVESLVFSLIHKIQEQAVRSPGGEIQLQLPLDMATYLLNEKRHLLEEIENRHQVIISVIPNHYLTSPQYFTRYLSADEVAKRAKRNIPSYKLVKLMRTEMPTKPTPPARSGTAEPLIKNFIPDDMIAPSSTGHKQPAQNVGLLKRLFNKMFGNEPVSRMGAMPQQTQVESSTNSENTSLGETLEQQAQRQGRSPGGNRYDRQSPDRQGAGGNRPRRRGGRRSYQNAPNNQYNRRGGGRGGYRPRPPAGAEGDAGGHERAPEDQSSRPSQDDHHQGGYDTNQDNHPRPDNEQNHE